MPTEAGHTGVVVERMVVGEREALGEQERGCQREDLAWEGVDKASAA